MTTPTEAMRQALHFCEQVKDRADSANGIGHLYEGDCPDESQPTARDPACPACRTMDAADAAITALRDALSAAPQPPAAQPATVKESLTPAAQQGEAVAPEDTRPKMRGCIETIKQAHDESLEGEHASARVMLRDVVAELELLATQTAAAPQPVAQGDRVRECAQRLVDHADFCLGGVLSASSKAKDIPSKAYSQVKARHLAALRDALAAAPAGVVGEPVYQCQGADGRWTDQVRSSYDYNARHGQAVRVLYTAPPARQALTDEQIDKLMPSGIQSPRLALHRMARIVERACAESWGVTLAGIGVKKGAGDAF